MNYLTASQGVCYGAPMGDITRKPGIKAGPPSTTNGKNPDPHFEVQLITPETAKEWVDNHNTHNRPVKWKAVKQYVGAMRRGEWKLNGDAIRFDYNGVLIDGQNRLYAIIESGIPTKSLVGTGLEPEAQDTMDLGARRSLSDMLTLRGETNVSRLASVIKWTYLWDRFIMTDVPPDDRIDPPTLQQQLEFFNAHKSRIIVAVKEGDKLHHKLKAAPAAISGTCWYIFHELNWEDCQDFFYKLGLGASLEEDNPIFVLRRWLANHSDKRDRPRVQIYLAVWVKAWNLYREGGKTDYFAWRGGGSKPERFPVAR